MTDDLGDGVNDSDPDDGDEPAPEHAKVWMNESNDDLGSEPPPVNVKSEWESVTVYLPESLRDDLELAYRELSYESKRTHDRDVQKLRDFYPLIVAMGLESLESTDSEDILSVLNFLLNEYE